VRQLIDFLTLREAPFSPHHADFLAVLSPVVKQMEENIDKKMKEVAEGGGKPKEGGGEGDELDMLVLKTELNLINMTLNARWHETALQFVTGTSHRLLLIPPSFSLLPFFFVTTLHPPFLPSFLPFFLLSPPSTSSPSSIFYHSFSRFFYPSLFRFLSNRYP